MLWLQSLHISITPIHILSNEDLFALNLTDGKSRSHRTEAELHPQLGTDLLLVRGRTNIKEGICAGTTQLNQIHL